MLLYSVLFYKYHHYHTPRDVCSSPGDNLGVFVVNPLSVRRQQRSFVSSAWLLPYDTYWNKSEVLVTGPYRNYTVHDYQQFFTDVDFPTGYNMRLDTASLIGSLAAPGVEMHCVHGRGVNTPQRLIYSQKQWYDYQPDVEFGDGDGTVNIRSLRACLDWRRKQKQPITLKEFEGAESEHITILRHQPLWDYIRQVVTQG